MFRDIPTKISYYYYKIPPASSIRNSDAVLTLFLRSEVEITLQLRRHYIVCYTEHFWVHMTLKFETLKPKERVSYNGKMMNIAFTMCRVSEISVVFVYTIVY